MNGIRLGVAYYPEHDPEGEWESDARLMQELGLDCIRVGEFCWSRMQRNDGTLTLDWLQRLVELFDRYGIKTILCTPTATPPAWICDRYPDLPLVTPDGRKGLFGGRRHYSVFHEGYRRDCREIAEALASRFGSHPAVIGWQIDNEAGTYSIVDCSPPALAAFHRWIERKHGSVDALNKRWGLIFWNQEVERFDQIPAPTEMMTTRNPSLLLDYNRFCIEGVADFLLQQAEVMRPHLRGQFLVASAVETVMHDVFRLQRERRIEHVDAVSVHNYAELMPAPFQAAMHLDRFRGIAPGKPMLVMEHQVGSGYTTTGGLDPAVRRFWCFETLASGSRALLWFQWRRFRTGCEWRLTSVVERDRRKRANFTTLQSVVREIRGVEAVLAAARVVGDIQVLYSQDNALGHDRSSEGTFWMEIQLPEAARYRFPMWEREVLRSAYAPLTHLGLTIDFVAEGQAWDSARPLVATDLDICTPATVDRLTRFCRAGGTLICFPGAGERDEHGAHRESPPPGILAPLFGVELLDYYPLAYGGGSVFDHQMGRAKAAEGVTAPTTARVKIGRWSIPFDIRHGEVLDIRDARVIGTYAEGPLRGRPAAAERQVGKGRAIYLGAVPAEGAAAEALYAALLPAIAGKRAAYRRVKLDAGGSRYEFLLNGRYAVCPLGRSVSDLITKKRINRLPAFGVALVKGA